jgi:hypothetical protein
LLYFVRCLARLKYAYRDRRVVGVFVRFSCAFIHLSVWSILGTPTCGIFQLTVSFLVFWESPSDLTATLNLADSDPSVLCSTTSSSGTSTVPRKNRLAKVQCSPCSCTAALYKRWLMKHIMLIAILVTTYRHTHPYVNISRSFWWEGVQYVGFAFRDSMKRLVNNQYVKKVGEGSRQAMLESAIQVRSESVNSGRGRHTDAGWP